MKNLISTFFLLFFCIYSKAQLATHTFHLKDGTIVKGKIIEKLKDDSYIVKLDSVNNFFIKNSNIDSIDFDINIDAHKCHRSIGFSILGDGVVGAHFRQYLNKEIFLNIAGHINPVGLREKYNNTLIFYQAIVLAGGIDYFIKKKYKEKKHRVVANGIFITASHTFSRFDSSKLSVGWSSEYFAAERIHRSILLHMGWSGIYTHWIGNENTDHLKEPNRINFSPYLKLTWLIKM